MDFNEQKIGHERILRCKVSCEGVGFSQAEFEDIIGRGRAERPHHKNRYSDENVGID